MRILFDHNVDRRFRSRLTGHEVKTAREKGWEKLGNGVLLKTAADAGFEAMLTVDKKLEYEQNLRTLPLAVILIDSRSNALATLMPFSDAILELLNGPLERLLYIVQPGGNILPVTVPRVKS